MQKDDRKKFKKSLDKTVRNRILILSFVMLAFFGLLVMRLVQLQVFEHDSYTEKQDDYTSIRQYTSAPRGQIYDRNGNVLAKTVVTHNIVYTQPNNTTYTDMLLYADRIGEVFELSLDDFTASEMKEAYLTYTTLVDEDSDEYLGLNLLSESQLEKYNAGEMTSDQLRSIQLKAIDDDVLDSAEQRLLKTAAIYNRMSANASTGQASVIAMDVSDADVAYLVENRSEFPGFDIDFGGWKREYPYGEVLSDILGSVTTSVEGLPEDYATEYLAKGYQYNAQVGKSGLEYQYNDLLAGTDEVAKIVYDSNGIAHKQVLQSAKKGYDIYLSIDIELQQTLDETVKAVLVENAGTTNRENFYSLFTGVMDPRNGDILAMSGYQMDPETRAVTYFGSGNYLTLVNPGSSIKGATVYMGISEGVVTPDEYITDEQINVGGALFASYSDHGPVNAVDALEVSSNVYMFNVAMRLNGDTYEPGVSLNADNIPSTLNLMRSYYSMFGLGNQTGLDVPYESDGYMGVGDDTWLILNYSIGQFDMYTPVQLLQYAATVASGGTMYQPRFYLYSKEVNGDQIFDMNEATVKSVLPEENSEAIETVQQGFAACIASGYCSYALENYQYTIAAKTGTAEVGEWTTANFIGYAPYEDPSMAFACSAPTSSVNSQSVSSNLCAEKVMPAVLDKYFELYPREDLLVSQEEQ